MATDADSGWYAAYLARKAAEREALLGKRADWLKALKAGGALYGRVTYDGSGDEGAIQEVVLYRARPATDDPSEDLILASQCGYADPPAGSLLARVMDWAWEVLEAFHAGWENNEGGCGEITFDVEANEVSVHHGTRIEQIEYEDTTV